MKLKVILRGEPLFSLKNEVYPLVELLVGSELECRFAYCDQSACVFRGNRTKFRGAGAEDYAGLLSMDIDF